MLFLVSLVIISPFMVLGYISADWVMAGAVWPVHVLMLTIRLLLLAYLIGALSYWVFGQLGGPPVTVLQALSRTARRIGPVIGTAILSGIVAVVGFLVFASPGLLLNALAPAAGSETGMATASAVGNILLGVGGLINLAVVVTALWVAVPVAVIERPGVIGSLRRSRDLVTGNRSTVFGIIVVLMLLELGVVVFGTVFASMVLGFDFLETLPFFIAVWLVVVAFSAFTAVITGAGYVLLRVGQAGSKAHESRDPASVSGASARSPEGQGS